MGDFKSNVIKQIKKELGYSRIRLLKIENMNEYKNEDIIPQWTSFIIIRGNNLEPIRNKMVKRAL